MIGALLALILLCGEERVGVKNLADADAAKIDATLTPTTVEAMVALPAPEWSESLLRQPVELKTFVVNAKIVGFKHERPPKGDGDFHVVIAGDSGATMIVEFPDPACAPNPDVAAKFAAARQQFLEFVGRKKIGTKFTKLAKPLPATVTGIGFFDHAHGQTGVAPNAVELHPCVSVVTVP
jgi:hypothetical protein